MDTSTGKQKFDIELPNSTFRSMFLSGDQLIVAGDRTVNWDTGSDVYESSVLEIRGDPVISAAFNPASGSTLTISKKWVHKIEKTSHILRSRTEWNNDWPLDLLFSPVVNRYLPAIEVMLLDTIHPQDLSNCLLQYILTICRLFTLHVPKMRKFSMLTSGDRLKCGTCQLREKLAYPFREHCQQFFLMEIAFSRKTGELLSAGRLWRSIRVQRSISKSRPRE